MRVRFAIGIATLAVCASMGVSSSSFGQENILSGQENILSERALLRFCTGGDLSPKHQGICDDWARLRLYGQAWRAFYDFERRGACDDPDLLAAAPLTAAHCENVADVDRHLVRTCLKDLRRELLPRPRHKPRPPSTLDGDTRLKCNTIRFLGEFDHYRVHLSPDGAVHAFHLIETGSGREPASFYPHGLSYAAQDDATGVLWMPLDALDAFLEGRITPGDVEAASSRRFRRGGSPPGAPPSGYARSLAIGWNESTGPTSGNCFNYSIAPPGNNTNVLSYDSSTSASSFAGQVNVSSTVSTSVGLFKVDNSSSFSDKWQTSTFSDSQYYNAYSMWMLNITVDPNNPLTDTGLNAGAKASTLCGRQYLAAVPVGMISTISIDYGSSSSSTSTAISDELSVHSDLTNFRAAVSVAKDHSSSDSYFNFNSKTIGGGVDANKMISQAFASPGDGEAYRVQCANQNLDACTSFSSVMGEAAAEALGSFNDLVSGLGDITSPKLDFLATFPSGVAGAILPQTVTLPVPDGPDDILAPYATALRDQVSLVNELTALNNRASNLAELIQSNSRLNYPPHLDVTTALRILGSDDDSSLYATARAALLKELGACLDATTDNVTSECAGVAKHQGMTAFDYFGSGSDASNYLAQQNTIALQYTVEADRADGAVFPYDLVYIAELPPMSVPNGPVVTGEAALNLVTTRQTAAGGGYSHLVVLDPTQPISTDSLSSTVSEQDGVFTLLTLANNTSDGTYIQADTPDAEITSNSCTPLFHAPCDISFGVSGLSHFSLRRIDGMFD